MQPTQPPSMSLFFDTANAFQRTAAIKAAVELKLFSAIAEGKDTPAALASHCKIAQRGARILADYLTTLGFLTKHSDRYALTPDTALFLNDSSPAYIGNAIQFLCAPESLAGFADLTNRVRNGGAPKEDLAVTAAGQERWIDFARGMAGLMQLPAQLLAKLVLAGDTSPIKVLDIAASHGLFGIAFAMQNPNAKITALDWPAVLPVAKENAAKANVLPRFETLPGNALEVDFGTNYDIILLPNFLHHFDAPTCERLLKKVHAALKPAGRAVTLEFIPNEDRISPPTSATFPLVMLAHTAAGDAYTFKEFQQMFKTAGFPHLIPSDLPPTFQQVLIAQK